jgi:hypothetical protein
LLLKPHQIPTELAGRRILVIEDDYSTGIAISRELAENGATVIGPVSTVGTALAVLGQVHIDLAVMKFDLRGQQAMVLVSALEERGIPFVFTAAGRAALPPPYRQAPRWERPFRYRSLVGSLPYLGTGVRGQQRQHPGRAS